MNKLFYLFAYMFLCAYDFLFCRWGDKFIGGKIRVGQSPDAMESRPKRRKLNPGEEVDTSAWGNVLFLNSFSYVSGIRFIWDTKNKDIPSLSDKQALDGQLTRWTRRNHGLQELD